MLRMRNRCGDSLINVKVIVKTVKLITKPHIFCLDIQSALVITRYSGSLTSNHVISEACYIQCVALFVARGN